MQLEAYLERDDRIVLPLGSTEQHAYLSLETDNILAERVAVEAAEPLGVPVLPVLAYGLTPSFAAYPGLAVAAHRDVRARGRRPARLALRAGLPPHPHRQRPRREHAGARTRRRVERRARRRAGDLARLVERAGGRRDGRLVRPGLVARVVVGELSRGRGSRASSFRRRRRSACRCRCRSSRSPRGASPATARSAVATCGRTTRCSSSGARASRACARCSRAAGTRPPPRAGSA